MNGLEDLIKQSACTHWLEPSRDVRGCHPSVNGSAWNLEMFSLYTIKKCDNSRPGFPGG